MTHTRLFALSLFLVFPAATQCMEKEIVVKPKTMQNIRDKRNKIYEKALAHEKSIQLDSKFRKKNQYNQHSAVLSRTFFQDQPFTAEDLQSNRSYLASLRFEEYSCLSLAIIAIQHPKFVQDYDKWGQMHNHHLMQNPKQAPFKEKKKAVQTYLKIHPQPTNKDKYFALLTKYEEFGSLIIKKILLLQDILSVLGIELPQEVRDIPLLMFNMEESLL